MSFDIILNIEKKTIEKKVKLLDLTNDNTNTVAINDTGTYHLIIFLTTK